MTVPSLFQQLLSASASAAQAKAETKKPPWPPNPFPSGIQPGSATEMIRIILESDTTRWHEHCELMRKSGLSRGAVTWGLKYLSAHGMVRSIQSARHPMYRRYQSMQT